MHKRFVSRFITWARRLYFHTPIASVAPEGMAHHNTADRAPQAGNSEQGSSIPLPPGVSAGCYTGFVDSPPPGLVRANPPEPTTYAVYRSARMGHPRVLNNDNAAMFHHIAKFFKTGYDLNGSHILLDLHCNICCTNQIEVPSKLCVNRSPDDTELLEEMMVLPCGHIFGADCMNEWIHTRRDEDTFPDCPMCRFPLFYPECAHEIRLRAYNPNFPREVQVPLTIPEGGVVPQYCPACRLEFAQYSIEKVLDAVYPRTVPVDLFRDASRCGPDDFAEFRARLRDDLFQSFCWSKKQFFSW